MDNNGFGFLIRVNYNNDTGHFVYGEPKLQVIRDELDLCGYFAIISSEKMDAKKAISLYKNREQYDRLNAELEELHKKQKALQSEVLLKAIKESSRSYGEILIFIQGKVIYEQGIKDNEGTASIS